MVRRVKDFLGVLILFGSVALLSAWLAQQAGQELSGRSVVLDGDSLRLADQEIRLLGIDAPEFSQQCVRLSDGEQIACGRQSRNHLRALIDARDVICDGWEQDKFDRLLAVCSVEGVELNRTMVADGWAVSFGAYEGEEAIASANGKGLWSSEFQRPSEWRRDSKEAHSTGGLGWIFKW